MIEAQHTRWARLLFNPYIDRLLRKEFGCFYCVNNFPDVDRQDGLVITPNHFSWWDGFFVDFVNRKLIGRRLYMMMLEQQLQRYWFFGNLGAFSINLESTSGIRESIRYTRTIIRESNSLIAVFPQGEIQPYDKRPVSLRRGIQRMIPEDPFRTHIIPAAGKIQYGDDRKPDIYYRFGEPVDTVSLLNDFGLFEHVFRENLELLDTASFEKTYTRELFGKSG
jgi:1-acyl-sn-glycerol-3-phosphate acyltransferase